jgi:hypothetical protein
MRTILRFLFVLLVLVFIGCRTETHGKQSAEPMPTPIRAGHRSPPPSSTPEASASPRAGKKTEHARVSAKAAHPPAIAGAEPPSSNDGSTAEPAADPDTLLDNIVEKLPKGGLAINHPDPMKAHRPDTVTVRIARNPNIDLTAGLPAAGSSTEHDIVPVSAAMKVEILGDSNFDVKPLDELEQLITSSDSTQWRFTVTPLHSGKFPLHAKVTAIVRAAGAENTKDVPVKDEIIRISVSPGYAVKSFIAGNWQWLWTTIVVPVALWSWNKRRKAGGKPDSAGKSAGQTA